MAEKTEIDAQVEQLYKKSQERDYKGRKMNINVDSLQEGAKLFRVTGTLYLAVSETPDDPESWIEKDFNLMILDERPEDAIASILMHMSSIPSEFGDMIFEPEFDDLMIHLKQTDD